MSSGDAAPRPAVEHYARCSVPSGGLVVEPGLELRDGDDIGDLICQLETVAIAIGIMAGAVPDRSAVCTQLASVFEERWPGRAWFVEIHDAWFDRWTQSYQPYGIPRSR